MSHLAITASNYCKTTIDIVRTILLNQRCKGFLGSDPHGEKHIFIQLDIAKFHR